MAHDPGKLGAGLGAQSVTTEERKAAADPGTEELMVAGEVRAATLAGAETDLLIEKRKSMEQIRHHRVSWTRTILFVPAVLFVALVLLLSLTGVDWRVLITFAAGTFSCILGLVPGGPGRPLPASRHGRARGQAAVPE